MQQQTMMEFAPERSAKDKTTSFVKKQGEGGLRLPDGTDGLLAPLGATERAQAASPQSQCYYRVQRSSVFGHSNPSNHKL